MASNSRDDGMYMKYNEYSLCGSLIFPQKCMTPTRAPTLIVIHYYSSP